MGAFSEDRDLEQFTAGLTEGSTPSLPAVPQAKVEAEEQQMSQRTVRQDAAEWVQNEVRHSVSVAYAVYLCLYSYKPYVYIATRIYM